MMTKGWEQQEGQEVAVGYRFYVSEGLDTFGDFMPEKKKYTLLKQ